MNGKMTPGPTRDNQATLGNGCVCASGCPACDTLAEAWGAMVEALTRALNYWEPPCKAEDCDKGSHVEQLLAWRRATRALTLARRVTYRERSGG